jgi:hypothetical protein
MRRFAVTALLLVSVAFTTPLVAKDREPAVDVSNMNHIFLGWVDINSDDYRHQGYPTREEYLRVIKGANADFQEYFRSKLPGKTVTGAEDRADAYPAGNDLYIKFSDAEFTHGYRLRVSIHFIDLTKNAEIGSIPLKQYTGRFCSLESCMRKELEEVADELAKQLGGGK